ncbi:uncharacterized protein LOC131540826 [Onychostoma macrolepis]|uniref:uncharacterized protein LOC131540826 n=1 Tax=Onychostoma macrolepis TaxID=369639 RepID=UPI00272C2E85|nr:uncharacterized protein LOC131540826 [Onychostoma macrolepis]
MKSCQLMGAEDESCFLFHLQTGSCWSGKSDQSETLLLVMLSNITSPHRITLGDAFWIIPALQFTEEPLLCLPACVPPEKIPSYKRKMSWSDTVEVMTAKASGIWSFITTDKNEQLIRSTQTLHHYVNRYFTITNTLLNIINTHFGESYSSVSADESKSIKDNCTIVRDAMSMILEVSKRKEKQILKIIDPGVYDKIAFAGVSLKDKAAVIRDFHADKLGVFGNIFLPLPLFSWQK